MIPFSIDWGKEVKRTLGGLSESQIDEVVRKTPPKDG